MNSVPLPLAIYNSLAIAFEQVDEAEKRKCGFWAIASKGLAAPILAVLGTIKHVNQHWRTGWPQVHDWSQLSCPHPGQENCSADPRPNTWLQLSQISGFCFKSHSFRVFIMQQLWYCVVPFRWKKYPRVLSPGPTRTQFRPSIKAVSSCLSTQPDQTEMTECPATYCRHTRKTAWRRPILLGMQTSLKDTSEKIYGGSCGLWLYINQLSRASVQPNWGLWVAVAQVLAAPLGKGLQSRIGKPEPSEKGSLFKSACYSLSSKDAAKLQSALKKHFCKYSSTLSQQPWGTRMAGTVISPGAVDGIPKKRK